MQHDPQAPLSQLEPDAPCCLQFWLAHPNRCDMCLSTLASPGFARQLAKAHRIPRICRRMLLAALAQLQGVARKMPIVDPETSESKVES